MIPNQNTSNYFIPITLLFFIYLLVASYLYHQSTKSNQAPVVSFRILDKSGEALRVEESVPIDAIYEHDEASVEGQASNTSESAAISNIGHSTTKKAEVPTTTTIANEIIKTEPKSQDLTDAFEVYDLSIDEVEIEEDDDRDDLDDYKPTQIDLTLEKSFKPKKITYFLHFHKAGGTSLCESASKSNYITNAGSSGANCNVFIRNVPCCGETISEQQNYAENPSNRYNFIANEKSMPKELDHEFYSYVVIFRNPWDRYASHYKFARDYYFSEKIMGNFQTWVKAQPDNFMLRNLCGPECLNVPRGKLTFEKHFQLARNRLEEFSAVLLLENIDESMEILYEKFHFKRQGQSLNNPLGSLPIKQKYENHNEVVVTDEIKENLNEMVMFDMELYAYARYLNRRLLEGIKKRELYSAKSDICVSECCSETCSKFRK